MGGYLGLPITASFKSPNFRSIFVVPTAAVRRWCFLAYATLPSIDSILLIVIHNYTLASQLAPACQANSTVIELTIAGSPIVEAHHVTPVTLVTWLNIAV